MPTIPGVTGFGPDSRLRFSVAETTQPHEPLAIAKPQAEGRMSQPKSILIVGGGVIGMCTAYYALREGLRVTVLERGPPDHDCCSLGNAGFIVPSHYVPLAAPGMVGLGLRMLLKPRSPFYIKPRLNLALLRWLWLFCRSANPGHVLRSAPLILDLSLASRACFEELSHIPDNDFGFSKKGLLLLFKT